MMTKRAIKKGMARVIGAGWLTKGFDALGWPAERRALLEKAFAAWWRAELERCVERKHNEPSALYLVWASEIFPQAYLAGLSEPGATTSGATK